MAISERQRQILDGIIIEYTDSAQPVSSQFLEERYNFKISPATIRNEMQKLTDKGYLLQPHTSAGRIPTDKGYRFFVDELFESSLKIFNKNFLKQFAEIKKEREDIFKFIQALTKNLASASSCLALTYLSEKDYLCKEGLGEIFQDPEFRDFDYALHFVKMIDRIEREIKKFILESSCEPRVYIGKENPLSKSKDFSVIISKCCFPMLNQEGIVAILGPKRMPYEKNLDLINSLIKSLDMSPNKQQVY